MSTHVQTVNAQPIIENVQPGSDLHAEDDLDKVFFASTEDALKKLKLNKGEKRALKFMIARETGENIDINAFLKSQSIPELKNLLTKEAKKQDVKKLQYEQTGAPKKVGKNNSNKQWNFKDMMDEVSD